MTRPATSHNINTSVYNTVEGIASFLNTIEDSLTNEQHCLLLDELAWLKNVIQFNTEDGDINKYCVTNGVELFYDINYGFSYEDLELSWLYSQ